MKTLKITKDSMGWAVWSNEVDLEYYTEDGGSRWYDKNCEDRGGENLDALVDRMEEDSVVALKLVGNGSNSQQIGKLPHKVANKKPSSEGMAFARELNELAVSGGTEEEKIKFLANLFDAYAGRGDEFTEDGCLKD